MRNRFFVILFLLIFICGCATTGYYHLKEEDLGVSDLSRFEDLPVPSGFKFLPLNSFISESGKLRVGVLEYYGKSFPYRIVKFYKENMPNYGWRILNIIESKETFLSFEKDSEICIVKFEYTGGKSHLIISISPLFKEENKPSKAASKSPSK